MKVNVEDTKIVIRSRKFKKDRLQWPKENKKDKREKMI